MHDVGMNMSQLAMSVKQVDDTIELAHEWSHQLLHATENFDMERIGAKLEAAMAALHEAHDALEGYEEAIEAEVAIPEELVAEAAEQAELNIIRY